MSAASQQVRAVGTTFLRLRPLLVGPIIVLAWALVATAAVPPAQLRALITGSGAMLAFFLVERWVAGRVVVGERWLLVSLAITVGGLAIGCGLSGGLASPFAPMLFAPSVTAFAAFGRDRRSLGMLAFLALVLGALALLPLPFPALPGDLQAPLAGVATILAAALLLFSVAGLSDAHVRAADALDRLRQDVLADAGARGARLESIGARVAHEIKNPLTAVKGLVQILAGGAPDDKSRERFAVVSGEIARMETILRDYLSFSRPLSDLRREPVHLLRLLGDVAGILEARAASAGVTVTCAGTGATVSADPRRLTEALLNLAGNALEASPRGARVELVAAEAEDGARLQVIDQGRGMSPEQLARLGTPFASDRVEGTGLGVVLARAVVEQHGGRLTFDSAPGRGTSVTVELPHGAPPPL